MAIVNRLERLTLERDAKHSEVNCTYSVVVDDDGKRWLQIDTYGSAHRQVLDKKSQSIRFSPQGIQELKRILETEF